MPVSTLFLMTTLRSKRPVQCSHPHLPREPVGWIGGGGEDSQPAQPKSTSEHHRKRPKLPTLFSFWQRVLALNHNPMKNLRPSVKCGDICAAHKTPLKSGDPAHEGVRRASSGIPCRVPTGDCFELDTYGASGAAPTCSGRSGALEGQGQGPVGWQPQTQSQNLGGDVGLLGPDGRLCAQWGRTTSTFHH